VKSLGEVSSGYTKGGSGMILAARKDGRWDWNAEGT